MTMTRLLRRWAVPSKTGTNVLYVAESDQPDEVIINTGCCTVPVVLTEAQFRAMLRLVGYGTECVVFRAEPESPEASE